MCRAILKCLLLLTACLYVESRKLSASYPLDQYNYVAGAVSNDGDTIYLAGLQNYNGDPILLQSTNGGKSYSSIDSISGGGGRIGSVATTSDGKTLVAGADDGVYIGSKSLTKVSSKDIPKCATKFSGFMYYDVAMSANGNVIATGCRRGGNIMVSNNGGKSWNKGPDGKWGSVQISNSGDSIIAASNNLVYISDDSGKTWSKSTLDEGFVSTAAVSGDGTVFYVNQYAFRYGRNTGSIVKSTDKGNTWQNLAPCIGLYPISSFSGTNILVRSPSPSKGPMLMSTDAGKSFFQTGPTNCDFLWSTIGFSNKGNSVYASCGSSLYRSTNDGTSWQSIGPAS